MMRLIPITLFLLISFGFVFSQSQKIDSLKLVLKNEPSDPVRFQLYDVLRGFYSDLDRDSALFYIEKIITLAKGKGQNLVTTAALVNKSYQLTQRSKYRDALTLLLQASTIVEQAENEKHSWLIYKLHKPGTIKSSILADISFQLGLLMTYTQNYQQALMQLRNAKRNALLIGNEGVVASSEAILCRVYLELNKLDSAMIFANSAEQGYLKASSRHISTVYWYKGNINFLKGDMQIAKSYYWRGINSGLEYQNLSGLARNYFALTKLYLSQNEKDSSLFYAQKSLEITKVLKAQNDNDPSSAYENLYLSYLQRNQLDSAFKYQGLALVAKDSLYLGRIKSLTEFQELTFQEQIRLRELEKEKETYQSKLKQYALLTGLGVLLLVAFILYRNNRQKQKANVVLQEQKEKIETTLTQLKATQAQLIQSEKMASLGELTAGIAHEIQNPLNFVNNFSELNNELIKEIKRELAIGNEQLAKWEVEKTIINLKNALDVSNDIESNSEKINQHGLRASSIVKGMLEHSRKSSGEKTLIDINALCDEYLRLSYHGLRAKDKTFNAKFETDFDSNLPKINVVPQDIGRVILNLINNAFYAVNEHANNQKLTTNNQSYEPSIIVVTKNIQNKIEIRVKDNGNGIPEKIKDKIFQPFFTTKPTGQGTGLGLSLAYDIIKAHGGELKVETKPALAGSDGEGEARPPSRSGTDRDDPVGRGSEFIIQLPLS